MSKLKKGTKALKDKLEKAKDKLKETKNVTKTITGPINTKTVISPKTILRNKRTAEMFRKANSKNKTLEKIKDGIKKSDQAGAISVAKTASVPGALLYATTETPMPGRGGETSSEPILTNPIKGLKTLIKMELEGKKRKDVSTRDILKYVEENPSYARRIYNRLVKGGEFNADELIKKVTKRAKEKGLKPYDFDKKRGVEKKRDGGMVRKKKPVKKKAMKKSGKGTKWESKWG